MLHKPGNIVLIDGIGRAEIQDISADGYYVRFISGHLAGEYGDNYTDMDIIYPAFCRCGRVHQVNYATYCEFGASADCIPCCDAQHDRWVLAQLKRMGLE